jgi:transposase-like protein
LQPGVSIASVALANQLNANQVRSWVKAHRDQQRAGVPANVGSDRPPASASCLPPRLVPVTVQATDAQPASDIQLEIRRQQTVVQIRWPASEAAACAQWLRDLLR